MSETPSRVKIPADALEMWVIYREPADWHDTPIVVRRWWVLPGGDGQMPDIIGHGFNELDAARDWVQMQNGPLALLSRTEDDDPAIVEVWL